MKRSLLPIFDEIMRFLTIFAVLCLPFLAFSQSKINLQGFVSDTLNVPLNGATILLLEPSDSTLISYTRTDENGLFSFKKIKNRPYLAKVSFVSFVPKQFYLKETTEETVDLGTIQLVELSDELMEVVIKEAKAPISIRGDTIEYDASTFKVPPGSTVEDLLKKLPGIEVDREGNIKSAGQDVTRVTVDGKRFFGSDPKMATKNLPAEGITKVQVFDTESEEKKLTGTSSTPPTKTMNLELKEEFKKGGFGKAVAGVGTDERAEIKGNYNKFNAKHQFALIGVANNTGRNGLGWNDYQDFRGSQTFNWGDDDEFGFGSGGGMYYYNDGNDDEDENGGSISNSFFGNDNSGYPENYTSGLNYNYDNKKTLFSGVYYFGQNGLLTRAQQNQAVFLPQTSYFGDNQNEKNRVSASHRVELRLEHKIDSLHEIIVSSNGSYNSINQTGTGMLLNRQLDNKTLINQNDFSSKYTNRGLFWKNSLVFSKKFKKKGRSLGFSAGHFYNDNEKENSQISQLLFFDESGLQDSSLLLNQVANPLSERTILKSSGMYTEPIGKKFFWQTFYNVRNRKETGESPVFDLENTGQSVQNDQLSRFYDNTIQMQRVGTSLRYAYKGSNITLGGAHQRFLLDGTYSAGPTANISGTVDRTFERWIPYAAFTKSMKRNRYLNLEYQVNINEPSVRNLQPIVDNSNPLFVRVGNPDLVPQVTHQVSARLNRWDNVTFINYHLSVNYNYDENGYISNQKVDDNLVTTSQIINYTGGQGMWSYMGFGFPIVKNRFTVNLSNQLNYGKYFAFVNDVRNKTTNVSNRPQVRLNITPNDNFSVFVRSSVSLRNTTYDINTSQNQKIIAQTHSVELNVKLPFELYTSTDFNLATYQNDRFGGNQTVPILNASIYRSFLKDNRGEIRLSIYDAFKENRSINQIANQNLVSETLTETLTRYAMLSFTYNMRGMKTGVKKKDGWW